jgi:hypothetical protein
MGPQIANLQIAALAKGPQILLQWQIVLISFLAGENGALYNEAEPIKGRRN